MADEIIETRCGAYFLVIQFLHGAHGTSAMWLCQGSARIAGALVADQQFRSIHEIGHELYVDINLQGVGKVTVLIIVNISNRICILFTF